jgi:hypothetical protein
MALAQESATGGSYETCPFCKRAKNWRSKPRRSLLSVKSMTGKSTGETMQRKAATEGNIADEMNRVGIALVHKNEVVPAETMVPLPNGTWTIHEGGFGVPISKDAPKIDASKVMVVRKH